MAKRIAKILLWTLVSLVGLVILTLVLLYLPPVQNLIRKKALPAISRTIGMELSVESLRIRFPLRIDLRQVTAQTAPGDTLFHAGSLTADVALLPLLAQEVVVRQFELDQVVANYADSAQTIVLQARLEKLDLKIRPMRLKKQRIRIPYIILDSARVAVRYTASPDTTAFEPFPDWTLRIDQLDLRRIDFELSMDDSTTLVRANLPQGSAKKTIIELAPQTVSVQDVFLKGGVYAYLTDTDETPETVPVATVADSVADGLPWQVEIAAIRLEDNALDYGVMSGTPAPGIDPDHIRLTAVNLELDSLYFREPDLRAHVKSLSLNERSGLELRSLTAHVAMDSTAYRIDGLSMTTAHSQLTADAVIGTSIVDLAADALLQADVAGRIGMRDALLMYPPAGEMIPRSLAGRNMTLNGRVNGRLGDLHINRLQASMPGNFTFTANGRVRNLPDIDRMEGNVTLNGDFRDLSFVREMVPDTALRNRIALPPMTLSGNVRSAAGTISPDLQLTLRQSRPAPPTDYGTVSRIPIRADSLWQARAARQRDDSDTSRYRRRGYLRSNMPFFVSDTGDTIRPRPPFVFTAGQSGVHSAGTLALRGSFNLAREDYDLHITSDSLPVYEFLPKDSLGLLSLRLDAQGHGFDPLGAATTADVNLRVTRADFRAHAYRNISLTAVLKQNRLAGRFSARDEALRFSFDLGGKFTRDEQQATVKGSLRQLDLYGLHFTDDDLRVSLALDAAVRATKAGEYDAKVVLDSITLRDAAGYTVIPRVTAKANADASQVGASIVSGDMKLAFTSPMSLDSLAAAFGRTADAAARQIAEQQIDMQRLGDAIPAFRLDFTAGWHNVLNEYLFRRNMSFDKMSLTAHAAPDDPLRIDARLDGAYMNGMLLDTVGIRLWADGRRLDYSALMHGISDAENPPTRLVLDGYAVDSILFAHALHQNRNGQTGFDLGLKMSYADSLFRASFQTSPLVLGYKEWTVNESNYITFHLNRTIEADLQLRATGEGGGYLFVQTARPSNFPPGIRLDAAKLDIGTIMELFPGLPPVSGKFNSDLLLATTNRAFAIRGEMSVDSLAYDGTRIGDVALRATYANLPRGQRFGTTLSLDGTEVATARGTYSTPAGAHDSIPPTLDATINVPGLPLAVVNAFIPDDMARLSGSLQGSIRAQGAIDDLTMNGAIRFAEAGIEIPMVSTRYRLSEDPIGFVDNILKISNFALLAPNNSRLVVNGQVDARDFANMTSNLRIQANRFQAFNTSRKVGVPIFGTALVDLDATLRGPVMSMALQATLNVLSGTDVTYIIANSPLDAQVNVQDVVDFVPFTDSLALRRATMAPRTSQSQGMTAQINVNIDPAVQVTVFLSDDGNNRGEVRGGGSLTFTMNAFGDTRLMGRYTITGGRILYKPPAIPAKDFTIRADSYVEFTGEMMNPTINLTAVETVRTTVSGATSGQVDFEVMLKLRNALENLSVGFDVEAPNNAVIQNELAGMEPEQRAMQAMSLLIQGVYTGPETSASTSGSGDLLTDQANAILERQLNSLARNTLRGVDLTFGIDSYNTVNDGREGIRTNYSYRLQQNFFNNRVRTVIGGSVSSDATPSSMANNLIDDISIEYMLNDRDNMYLKIFRHTSYESILEGEVVKTGVGFVVSRRMMRMRELFRFTKKRDEFEIQPADTTFQWQPIVLPARDTTQRMPAGTGSRSWNQPQRADSTAAVAPATTADSATVPVAPTVRVAPADSTVVRATQADSTAQPIPLPDRTTTPAGEAIKNEDDE